MIEHYGEPVPIRNANMSRNSATPPTASELSSTDNLKEKILEEVIGDVKKRNGAGGKLLNEATDSSVDMESKEDKENMNMTRSMSVNEKILEEDIGDVKKMNGTGGKLFNEAIAQMSSTIVREEDKRKDEKEIKSDTGTMIDQSIVTNKNINYY